MAARRKRGSVSPTLLAFGRQLRRYREAVGLSQESAGRRANGGQGVSSQYVGQVESGRTRCTREFAATMDAELKAGGRLLELWDDLVLDSAFPTWFDWPNIEAEAVMIQSYQPLLVHGLLQTPGYASAILRSTDVVEARLNRQKILTRRQPAPPVFSLLLDEVALHRATGDSTVMREQLEHLLTVGELPNVALQIVPSRGEHLGNSGAFNLATLEDRSEVAYVESAIRGLTINDPDELASIARTLIEVRSLALPASHSRDIIRRTMEERWNH
ncbi:helix-turn-helix domain-containing protein [Actinocorallia populi]|uniref:helix-turn-helix domain-containing protein n=1 Tax=Actinocorallia populi TaxID=2079200 RepID=UPI000D092F8B|nr:helix-turn-helix transcriptional regulator [Actinocorallia populi]